MNHFSAAAMETVAALKNMGKNSVRVAVLFGLGVVSLVLFAVGSTYHCALFASPGSNFCYFVQVVDRWQTLIGACIAALGAALAFYVVRQQISQAERFKEQDYERSRRTEKIKIAMQMLSFRDSCINAYYEALNYDAQQSSELPSLPPPPSVLSDTLALSLVENEESKRVFYFWRHLLEAQSDLHQEFYDYVNEDEFVDSVAKHNAVLALESHDLYKKFSEDVGWPVRAISERAEERLQNFRNLTWNELR